jgi:hypothetical protein
LLYAVNPWSRLARLAEELFPCRCRTAHQCIAHSQRR